MAHEMSAIRKCYWVLKNNRDKYLKLYAKRMVKLQEDCLHPETRFVPDPSGNNDSYRYCLDCDKVI
jgi:hypothetical protein